jgi:hypothetical protein
MTPQLRIADSADIAGGSTVTTQKVNSEDGLRGYENIQYIVAKHSETTTTSNHHGIQVWFDWIYSNSKHNSLLSCTTASSSRPSQPQNGMHCKWTIK